MAINKGKVIFWSLTVAVIGVGGFFAYRHFFGNKSGGHSNLDRKGNLIDPTKDQDGNAIKPSGGGGGTGYNPPPKPMVSSTIPFTNTTEGNAFRAWVNNVHAPWAAANNLDMTGSYNNSYIKAAWNLYGAEYTASASSGSGNTASISTTPAIGKRAYSIYGGTPVWKIIQGKTGSDKFGSQLYKTAGVGEYIGQVSEISGGKISNGYGWAYSSGLKFI